MGVLTVTLQGRTTAVSWVLLDKELVAGRYFTSTHGAVAVPDLNTNRMAGVRHMLQISTILTDV